MEKEYILVQDNDGHWLVIPADKEEDFEDWCYPDDEDNANWTLPDYAEEVGGAPSLVKFKNYIIE